MPGITLQALLKLRRTVANYQARLQEADAKVDRANSDEYNHLMAELQYFSNLTGEMVKELHQPSPERQGPASLLPETEEKLRDALAAVRFCADQYTAAKQDQYMGYFRSTRKVRFDLCTRLSDFLAPLEEGEITEETADRLPVGNGQFIRAAQEDPIRRAARTQEGLHAYLAEVDSLAPFTFCGGDGDIHRLSFLQRTREQLEDDIGHATLQLWNADQDPDKDPEVRKMRAQQLLLDIGISARESMEELKLDPQDPDKQDARDLSMLRLSFALAYAKKVGWDAMDPQKLQELKSCSPNSLREKVDSRALDFLVDPPASLEELSKLYRLRNMSNGRFSQEYRFTYDGKNFHCSVAVSREKTLDNLLETESVKNLISSYKESSDYWLTSGGTEEEEAESRRTFVMAHRADLARIFEILAENGSAEENRALSEKLTNSGLDHAMEDYFYLTNRPAEHPVRELLGLDAEESPFSSLLREKAFVNQSAPLTPEVKERMKLQGRLGEFHRWMYRNAEKAGGSIRELFGGEGSARPFVEEFMRQDPRIQLKALYAMEHGLRRSDVMQLEDEDVKDYVPNLTQLKDRMIESKFKFWKRLSGNKHRWGKLRDYLKYVRDSEIQRHLGDEEAGLQEAQEPAQPHGDAFVPNVNKALNLALSGGTGLLGSDIPKVVQGLKAGDLTVVSLKDGQALLDTVYVGEGPLDIHQKSEVKGVNTLKKAAGYTKTGIGAAKGTFSAVNVGAKYAQKLVGLNLGYAQIQPVADIVGPVGSGLGVLLKTVQTGISLSQYDSARNAENMLDTVKKYGTDGMTEEQRGLYEKLRHHTRTAKLQRSEELKRHGMNLSAATVGFLCAAGVLAAAGPAISVALTVGTPILIMASYKMLANENRKVVDSELYKDEEDKTNHLNRLRQKLTDRFRNKSEKFKNAFRAKFGKLLMSDSKMASSARKSVMAKSGFVSVSEFKNYLVNRIGEDVYDGLNKLKKSEFDIYNSKNPNARKDHKTENLTQEEMKQVYQGQSNGSKVFRAYLELTCENLLDSAGLKYHSMEQRAQQVKKEKTVHNANAEKERLRQENQADPPAFQDDPSQHENDQPLIHIL